VIFSISSSSSSWHFCTKSGSAPPVVEILTAGVTAADKRVVAAEGVVGTA
jgi:hypothetical protein